MPVKRICFNIDEEDDNRLTRLLGWGHKQRLLSRLLHIFLEELDRSDNPQEFLGKVLFGGSHENV